MKYTLMIFEDEKNGWGQLPEHEQKAFFGEYGAFTQDIKQKGKYLGGERLQATSMATSVRVRNGKRLVTDGPFAETREQLGGFYLVEAANLDEAIELAARIPSARHGTIEIRPVVEMQQPAKA